jgi:hypothetical protein
MEDIHTWFRQQGRPLSLEYRAFGQQHGLLTIDKYGYLWPHGTGLVDESVGTSLDGKQTAQNLHNVSPPRYFIPPCPIPIDIGKSTHEQIIPLTFHVEIKGHSFVALFMASSGRLVRYSVFVLFNHDEMS